MRHPTVAEWLTWCTSGVLRGSMTGEAPAVAFPGPRAHATAGGASAVPSSLARAPTRTT
ncbi:hypothetical protein [Plantactinospora veratri]